jgi:signal transduction histidine kinase
MSRAVPRRAPRVPTSAIPFVVLAGSLLLTIVTSLSVAASADATERLRFEHEVQQTQSSIETRIETYISMLRGLAGLFAASDAVGRDEFRTYVEQLNLSQHYPGIQGIGYSARIAPQDLEAFVAAARAQGYPGYQVWPAGPRDEYHAIIYLEPLDQRNQAALGYDMFSDPIRRAAMALARDTGQPAASGRVTLVQEIDEQKQAGFLIYVPVYRGGEIPETTAERRDRLIGYVYGPFRADDLFVGIFSTRTDPLVAFEVYDGLSATPESLLHRSPGVETPGVRQSLNITTTLAVAGRPWTLHYHPRAAFETSVARRILPYLVAGGMLISLLLFWLVHLQVRARARAEAALRVRDEFLSVASHELKTPLTALLGNAQLLLRRAMRENHLPERDSRALRAMAEQAQRLNKLVTTLLDHSRIQSGRLAVDRAPLDLVAFTRRIVEETHPSLTDHTLTCVTPDEPLVVLGDELRLAQVVQNLIDNAVKYSPVGGPVTVELRRNGGDAHLTVTDRGLGIPPSALPHLFEQFYRASNIDPRNISGMGIGLFVIREIVLQHGGDVTVQSEEGEGSAFTVRLPLAEDGPQLGTDGHG